MKKAVWIGAVIVVLLATLFIGLKIRSNNYEKKFENAMYTSYTVKLGDTLWDIAEKYNKFDVSTNDYITKICKINHVSRDFIRQGYTLVLILPAE